MEKICIHCQKVFKRDKSKKCNSCIYKLNGTKPCNSCGSPISKKNQSGFCKIGCKRANQLANAETEFQIFGDFPNAEETAIYILKRDGKIFYVGSTKRLIPRLIAHKQKFRGNLSLHIVRNVPDALAVIEECREIVTQYDSGECLSNIRTPEPGKREANG